MNLGPLYHWSPAARHDQIDTDGLVPGRPPIVSVTELSYVCLGLSPAAAWAISAAMPHVEHIDRWELWQVQLADGDSIAIQNRFGPRLHEVQVHNTIPASRLWWVGQRQRQ